MSNSDTKSAALNAALSRLARRAYSRYEIHSWVAQKYTPEIADLTTAKLDALGYLDDADYAQRQVERLIAKGYGRRYISQKLELLGLPYDIIDGALLDEASYTPCDLKQLLERRYPNWRSDVKIKNRAIRFFIRRGHAPTVVYRLFD